MAEKMILQNGMRLLVETMPGMRSIATGVWIGAGSAVENESNNGISHVLEHMLFKGTPSRSALDISAAMDNVGGTLNAFTAKEQTCYYARCLDEHFPLSLSLLADMYENALLDASELAREKRVIIEEINMYEDSPDELVMDLFSSTLWPGHSYGRPISGTVSGVSALDRDAVYHYWKDAYHSGNTVLAVAGNISAGQALEWAETYFGQCLPRPRLEPKPLRIGAGDSFIQKDIEQCHICLGFPALPLTDPDYYAAVILCNVLGGSASARLFQEVREKRGLSYSAYSYLEAFALGGFLMAYASAQPASSGELIRVMTEQLLLLKEKGLTEDEISRNQEQLKGSILLSMESTHRVMSKLGKMELALGKVYSTEETVAKLLAVTPDDINRVIDRIIVPERLVMAQVGPQRIQPPEGLFA